MNRWKPLLIALSLSSTLLLAQEAAREPAQVPAPVSAQVSAQVSAPVSAQVSAPVSAPEQFHFSSLGKSLPELKLEEGDRWFNATKGLSVAASPLTVLGRGKPLLVAYTIPG